MQSREQAWATDSHDVAPPKQSSLAWSSTVISKITSATKTTLADDLVIGIVDPNTLFGLERTLLSSLNILLAIAMIGGGIMVINAGSGPMVFGAAMVFLALIFMVGSVLFFVHRLRVLARGDGASTLHSVIWLGCIALFLVVAIAATTAYAIIYPPDSDVWSAPVTISGDSRLLRSVHV